LISHTQPPSDSSQWASKAHFKTPFSTETPSQRPSLTTTLPNVQRSESTRIGRRSDTLATPSLGGLPNDEPHSAHSSLSPQDSMKCPLPINSPHSALSNLRSQESMACPIPILIHSTTPHTPHGWFHNMILCFLHHSQLLFPKPSYITTTWM
jgi:hypothetical protein